MNWEAAVGGILIGIALLNLCLIVRGPAGTVDYVLAVGVILGFGIGAVCLVGSLP